jgi:hypothetical protein
MLDRIVDRDNIEDLAKHAKCKDKTMVMAWVDAMVSVVANRQAF